MKTILFTLTSCVLIALTIAGLFYLIGTVLGPFFMILIGLPVNLFIAVTGVALISDIAYNLD